MHRFKICELVSGKVLDELPMKIVGDLSRGLQMYGEGTLALPLLDDAGELVLETWEEAILPWRSMILVVDAEDRIVWHGIPVDVKESLAPVATYPCRTIEAYLIERYVPTLRFRGKDQSQIFRDLVSVAGNDIGMEYDCPATGIIRDRDYADDENARVYDRVNELAAVTNGFNWTIDIVWGDDEHTFVRKIARLGYPHLGNRTDAPEHVFEHGQNLTDIEMSRPWSSGNAATHVRAVGEGEGESKVISVPVIDTVREAAGWPRLEARRSFSNVSQQQTIDDHARAVAKQLFGGQRIAVPTVREPAEGEDFTRLGDLSLGDTARVKVKKQLEDGTVWKSIDVVWPVVGWALSPVSGQYKPVLAQIGDDLSG